MLHQKLIPCSSSPFFLHAATAPAPCSSSSSLPPSPRGSAMPSYANHHIPMDGRMDAMKSDGAFPPDETAEETAAAANAALVERDGFSVEDLLDLEEFGEPDKDVAENEDTLAPLDAPVAVETEAKTSPGDSQPSSIVTYELPPPPPEMVDLPAHDVEEELEWVSRIMDDSLSDVPAPPPALALLRPPLAPHRRPDDGAYRALLPAPGPPRTPTICALSTEALVPVKAKRSKRSRSSAWPVSGGSLFSDSASSSATTSSCSSSSASFSSYFLVDPQPFGSPDLEGYRNHFLFPPPPPSKNSKHGKGGGKHKPKKRGRKPKHAAQLSGAGSPGDRRCSHCGVQKTPQWRAGPQGAKTLCNACGVRFKSGRLLPEYRPACSPTFVSSVHSNSHRKVLEMRRKKDAGILAPAVASF